MSSKKHRLQFDFSKDALKELDRIKEENGTGTRAELLRQSLLLYAFVMRQHRDGWTMEFRKGSHIKEVALL